MCRIKKRPICSLGSTIGWEAPEKEIRLIMCDKSQADKIITVHHYSHKPTKNSFLSFLVYYKGVVSGALQLGYGIRPKIKGEYNPDEVREFDRMWLSDEMPKFSETITLSLLHKFLRAQYPQIKHLISYADTSVGNEGIIYQAANYRLKKNYKSGLLCVTGRRTSASRDNVASAQNEDVEFPIEAISRHKEGRWLSENVCN